MFHPKKPPRKALCPTFTDSSFRRLIRYVSQAAVPSRRRQVDEKRLGKILFSAMLASWRESSSLPLPLRRLDRKPRSFLHDGRRPGSKQTNIRRNMYRHVTPFVHALSWPVTALSFRTFYFFRTVDRSSEILAFFPRRTSKPLSRPALTMITKATPGNCNPIGRWTIGQSCGEGYLSYVNAPFRT